MIDNNAVDFDDLGLSIQDWDGKVVVTDVRPDGIAGERGIAAGDRLLSVNGAEVSDVKSVGSAIAKVMESDRKAVLFQIESGDRSRFVALPVARG